MHIWLGPYAPNNVVQHTAKNTKHQAVGVKKRGSEITVIAMHTVVSDEVRLFGASFYFLYPQLRHVKGVRFVSRFSKRTPNIFESRVVFARIALFSSLLLRWCLLEFQSDTLLDQQPHAKAVRKAPPRICPVYRLPLLLWAHASPKPPRK
jgi:hypothetical protein